MTGADSIRKGENAMRATIGTLVAVLVLSTSTANPVAEAAGRGQTIHTNRVLSGLKQPVAFTSTNGACTCTYPWYAP